MTAIARRGRRLDAPPPEVYLVTVGMLLQFMAGHSSNYFFPVPLDRPLVLAGLGLALYRAAKEGRTWRPTLIHFVVLTFLGWILISMAWSGSLTSSLALFAWVDAVGLIPFAIYFMAPLVYSTPARRRVLLGGLTLLGLYLGLIALLEGLGAYQLVWPQYIYDPDHPHFGRAGGPARQVASNGLQLMGCGLAAVAFSVTSRTRRTAIPAMLVAALCLFGTFFTLTRSVWIGVVVGLVAALALDRRSLKWLGLTGASVVALLVLVLAVEPDLRDAIDSRLSDSRSAFDRINANSAAFRVLLARPLEGVGFTQFAPAHADWLWQSPSVPVTTTGIAVHNVPLGYAAELGLPGVALWLGCLLVAFLFLRRSPAMADDSYVLRRVAVAYVVCWLVVGMLVPMTYALPATLFWLFLAMPTHPSWLGYGDAPRPPGPGRRRRARMISASSRSPE
ncbi:O-antigen ligase family protein [Georgenia sp. Marseille-Q6866]